MGTLPKYYAARDAWLATFPVTTRQAYGIAMRQFEDWARPLGRLPPRASDITSIDCLKWYQHLQSEYGVVRANGTAIATTQTARSKFLALRSFLSHCERHAIIDRNPARSIRTPNAGMGNPRRVLPTPAIAALLSAASIAIRDAQAEIDGTASAKERHRRAVQIRAILLFMAGTGCRLGEASSLRWMDILDEQKPARVRILTKGNKPHYVLVRPEIVAALRALPRRDWADDSFVFHTGMGAPVSQQLVNAAFARLCAAAGLPKITSHSIRAMVATGLHAKGVPLIEIKNLLGHASVETTARYVRYADEAKHAAGLKIDFLG